MPHNQLNKADEEIKLAVDIIYLLETNDICPNIALKALEIVQKDLQQKIQNEDP